MLRRDRVIVCYLDEKYTPCFAILRNVRDLDRARIKRPIIDLIMHMSMPKPDVFGHCFKLGKRRDRKSGQRVCLVSFHIGMEHEYVERSLTPVLLYRRR